MRYKNCRELWHTVRSEGKRKFTAASNNICMETKALRRARRGQNLGLSPLFLRLPSQAPICRCIHERYYCFSPAAFLFRVSYVLQAGELALVVFQKPALENRLVVNIVSSRPLFQNSVSCDQPFIARLEKIYHCNILPINYIPYYSCLYDVIACFPWKVTVLSFCLQCHFKWSSMQGMTSEAVVCSKT